MVSLCDSSSSAKHGMVIGGIRGARACDMCGEERAKWYCAADEAYLCEKCDTSVHSANSVARRHDRVKLGSNGEPTLVSKLKSCHRKQKKMCLNQRSTSNCKLPTTKTTTTSTTATTTSTSLTNEEPSLQLDHNLQVPKVMDHSDLDAIMVDCAHTPSTHHKHECRKPSKKRARTPRMKPCSNQTLNKPILELNPPEIGFDPNPNNFNTMVKEEIKFGEDAIMLYHLLAMENDDEDDGDDKDDQIMIASLDVKPEPLSPCSTLTSKDVTDFNKAEEESESAIHEVPILYNEPLLQELIDDIILPSGDLMQTILPSYDGGFSTIAHDDDQHHYTPYIKPEFESCLQQSDNNGLIGRSKSTSPKMDMNGVFPEGSSGIDEIEGDSLSIEDEDSEIDTFDVMDLCSNANFGDCGTDGDGDGEDVIDNAKPAQCPEDMAIWKEEHCNSIFEGNPFKLGKGERGFVDCIETLDSIPPASSLVPPSLPQFENILSLRLDYQEVLDAWADRGSLWLDGQRPQMIPDFYFYGHANVEQYGGTMMPIMGESSCNSTSGSYHTRPVPDSGREARVMRYREKRRTRLFAKKIRYEVRKLNAERRPRMKGRFVKRSEITAM